MCIYSRKSSHVLEINLNAISYNFKFFKSKLLKVKMMVMEGFGYGNGGLEIAKLLEHQ
jgi:alanine racemase